MKKTTAIFFLIGLLSFAAAAAQTTSKPKTAAKPVEAKSANPKSANAKQTNTKSPNAQAKSSRLGKAEKAASEKSKSVKAESVKKPSAKIQPVKSQPATAKIAAKSNAKSTAKADAQPSVKAAPKSVVKPPIKSTANKPNAKPPVKTASQTVIKPVLDDGEIVGKIYANKNFAFAVTLPDDWQIADGDFQKRLQKEGFNLNVEAPKAASVGAQNKLNAATDRVRVLLTAYKSTPDANGNAILRVSVEDLRAVPQVRDAVDYFDSMRATYQNIKLPAGFTYSETQAEKLGAMQFGFLDVANGTGRKRMYATVRGGYAVMFTLTYNSDEDLAAIKNVLAAGDFKRR